MKRKLLLIAMLVVAAPLWAQTAQPPIHTASLCSDTDPVNAKACFGARGNLQISTCGIASGSATLSCAAGGFSADSIGRSVYVSGAGNSGGKASLQAVITRYVSPTQVIISTPALSSQKSVPSLWGNDDTAALEAAYKAAVSAGRPLYIPAGSYLHHGLNWTGNSLKIYGDSYGGTMLFALAVTNAKKTTPNAQTTGVDISGSGYNEIDHIAFFGGWRGLDDLAPKVNIFGARTGTMGISTSIAHIFDGDFFVTSGPYGVVLFGYEQSSFINAHFESNAAVNLGTLYLSAVNTPGLKSPYTTVVVKTSMTAVGVTGERTVFAGFGPQVVLDQGSGIDVYSISIRDAYINLSSGSFLSDVGTGVIRDVVLDKDNTETGGCLSCQAINIHGPAWNWQVTSMEFYADSGPLTNSPFAFRGGFLDGYARVDATGSGPKNMEFEAPSCAGSILQLGQQQATLSCTDYALASSVNGVIGVSVGPTHWTSGNAAPQSPCSVGSLYSNSGATSANTALYLCYPANTWTAVKTR